MTKTRPIIRWAGGKVWLTDLIKNYIPPDFQAYHEPFLGGASIFLALNEGNAIQHRSYLSDTNVELIDTYSVIRDNPAELIEALAYYQNTKGDYYSARESTPSNKIEAAARFLFLNRTSFNGIYRVNLAGEYNVPYGFRKMEYLFKSDEIYALSKSLIGTTLFAEDFSKSLERINAGDLVFLDPPYTVAHENNGFVKYNQKIFAWEDQERLKGFIEQISEMGAYYILTNAAHDSIKDLYDGIGNLTRLSRPSLIGGKGAKRDRYHEYLISNI